MKAFLALWFQTLNAADVAILAKSLYNQQVQLQKLTVREVSISNTKRRIGRQADRIFNEVQLIEEIAKQLSWKKKTVFRFFRFLRFWKFLFFIVFFLIDLKKGGQIDENEKTKRKKQKKKKKNDREKTKKNCFFVFVCN